MLKSLVNCNVRMGGTGTGIQVVNAICVLSVNVYNEIVFVVLWFWLFFLALATAPHILYLALLTAFPTVGIAVKSLGMDEESKVGRKKEVGSSTSMILMLKLEQNCRPTSDDS